MSQRGQWGAAIAGGFLVLYGVLAYAWAMQTPVIPEADVLYHADTSRVMWNETFLGHQQGRVIVHPLHVLVTVPFGVPLTALLGSRAFAAALIATVFAVGCLFALEVLLRRCTALKPLERGLFVGLLGVSAGHLTFAVIPETHVLSAFFLGLAACHLAAARERPVEQLPGGARAWGALFLRTGLPQMALAVGALVTNAALVPWCAWLRLSRRIPPFRRIVAVGVLSCLTLGVVGAGYVAQRALFFRAAPAKHEAPSAPPPAAPSASPDQPAVVAPAATGEPGATTPASASAGKPGWLRERVEREIRYATWSPRRALEVALATLVFNLYSPRYATYQLPPAVEGPPSSTLPAVRINYLDFDLWPSGWVGALAWIALLAALIVALIRKERKEAGASLRAPVPLFLIGWMAFYFVVFNAYHAYPIAPDGGNDVFLFSPNMLFPLVALVAIVWDRVASDSAPEKRRLLLAGLVVCVLAAAANSFSLHHDLLSLYGAFG